MPQGSILGCLVFTLFMNDLAYVVKQSKLSAYADDTQIFYADKDLAKVQDTINNDLYHDVDKWYTDNGMKRNHSKYQAIVMGKTQNKPLFRCENAVIELPKILIYLGSLWTINSSSAGISLKYVGKCVNRL